MSMTKEEMTLDLREHKIVTTLPADSDVRVQMMRLPGGAIICGKFVGRLHCLTGSIIIQDGATFAGECIADNVFIAGKVISSETFRSKVTGRVTVSLLSGADVAGDVTTEGFYADRMAKFVGEVTSPLPTPAIHGQQTKQVSSQ
jgi:cytoskeletal protein CcmA (bactofilin family)